MNQHKEVFWFKTLLSMACVLSGLLAGSNVDRYVVQIPGWQHLSLLDWAAYSLHADLGNGLLLYPFEAFGSFLLLFTASAIIVFHKSLFKQIALPVHLATIFAGIGLIFTFFAASIMMSIRTMENNEMLLHKAFDKFHFWGLLRAVTRLCSFIACVWAFTKNDLNVDTL